MVLLGVASYFTVFFSWAGFLSRFDLFFDLISHFRLQYLIVSAICSVLYLVVRRPIGASVMVVHALLNAFVILPYLWPAQIPARSEGVMFRALVFNVHQENEHKEEIIEYLKKSRADVLVLIEVNKPWNEALAPLDIEYPYSLIAPRDDNFGIALYSKEPFVNAEMKYLSVAGRPAPVVELDLKFQKLTIVGLHPFPPIRRRLYELRNSILSEIAELLREREGAKLVLGDLNTSPWSGHYSDFKDRGRLRSALKGHFIWRTWSGHLPAIFGLPIDHCMVSDEIVVRNVIKGPWLNSDHAPLICDLFVTSEINLETPEVPVGGRL